MHTTVAHSCIAECAALDHTAIMAALCSIILTCYYSQMMFTGILDVSLSNHIIASNCWGYNYREILENLTSMFFFFRDQNILYFDVVHVVFNFVTKTEP